MSSQPDKKYFTSKDTEKLISLLNLVATHSEFNKLTVNNILEFARLLNWSQTQLLPKIEANVFEVLGVRQLDPNSNTPDQITTTKESVK